ncbi:Rhodanese-like protein [Coniochaeta ligniaria NRRL 30616]|uniref:M-phase inducer phosphatase n=1 Tax=Coniochaeta ligniaria NRRL 30616 TaxID=1408157 RepID=A0A1J7JMD9_9PEZI|nr:Rhodanese-like protein [Coniochaeta ligniaria NRRL 30616]
MSPSDCFADSPTQDRRPQTANSPCAAAAAAIRPRPHFGSLTGVNAARNNGSPASGHMRRPSNPFMRPRKQFRRSLSMFENPGDITKPKKEGSPPVSTLQSVMDVEEPQDPVLPHFFPEGQNDSIPRISRSTMLEVLDGKYGEHFDQKMIIDCRFEYEYEGGHINGAINYNDKELLSTHLFRQPMSGRTLLIFHCEYSAHRAPIMARHIRAADRTANAECYPRLTYPEVYILDGGYSGFFTEHRDRCYPQAYVEMDHAEHVQTCEREMGRLRQNRKGLNRAATFAFGQQNPSTQDSPTAMGRRHSRESDDMLLGASPIFGNAIAATRRMASY